MENKKKIAHGVATVAGGAAGGVGGAVLANGIVELVDRKTNLLGESPEDDESLSEEESSPVQQDVEEGD